MRERSAIQLEAGFLFERDLIHHVSQAGLRARQPGPPHWREHFLHAFHQRHEVPNRPNMLLEEERESFRSRQRGKNAVASRGVVDRPNLGAESRIPARFGQRCLDPCPAVFGLGHTESSSKQIGSSLFAPEARLWSAKLYS